MDYVLKFFIKENDTQPILTMFKWNTPEWLAREDAIEYANKDGRYFEKIEIDEHPSVRQTIP